MPRDGDPPGQGILSDLQLEQGGQVVEGDEVLALNLPERDALADVLGDDRDAPGPRRGLGPEQRRRGRDEQAGGEREPKGTGKGHGVLDQDLRPGRSRRRP